MHLSPSHLGVQYFLYLILLMLIDYHRWWGWGLLLTGEGGCVVWGDQLFIERGVNAGLPPSVGYLQQVCLLRTLFLFPVLSRYMFPFVLLPPFTCFPLLS